MQNENSRPLLGIRLADQWPNIHNRSPNDVQKMVKPILNLCEKDSASENKNQNDWEAAKLVGALLRSKKSDEALVVLMHFYIGESTGSDLLHQITVRGKHMLPLLFRYRSASISFPDRNYPASIYLPTDIRSQDFDEVINAIRSGKVLGED